MTGDERRWLFVILAAMGLTLAALTLFLFGEHAPGVPEASPSQGPASATPAVPRLLVPPPLIAADEIVLCGYGRVKQSALDDIRAEARTAADSTFSRLQEKLAASRDARESALGLYLQRSIGSTEELAKLALGSRDPQVYALAFQSCGFVGYGASCALLSADRW